LSDREQRITSIFHSAIEREGTERRAFLDGACANDEELRREVESLIRSHEQAGSLMDSPAYERDASLVDEMDQNSFVGRTLGHYRIVRRLGGGGMGEVFLAEDTQLGRRVAVKILPHRLTADSSLVARFRQEARAASALNHANIVTIYEVGESDGTHFIATEYVEGVTLRERMSRTALTISQALDIAAQIAAALSKAHGAGVVHRDIKPENVMVDEEGHAKVLDFGIAKLVAQSRESATEAPTALKVETSPGAVMGTAHYMSPEQTRALRDVDARTDVWSLGVVLYEMLAGRLPFEGDTTSDVMVAILNKEPLSLARFNREVSEALELVVEKALEKNRDERYQTVKEMASDLRRIRQRFESGASARVDDQTDAGAAEARATSLNAGAAQGTEGVRPDETAAPIHTTSSAEYIVTGIKRHKVGVMIAGLALIVIAGGTYALYRYVFKPKPTPAHFERVKMTRITTEGNLQNVAVSPDGKYIAYSLLEAGKLSLWTKHLATDSRVQIVTPSAATGMTPYFFSHDGGYVFYDQEDAQNPAGALFQVAVLGGPVKRILTNLAGPASLSPNGKSLGFARYRPGAATEQYEVWLADADGANERRLWACSEPQWLEFNGVSWSPDGKLLTLAYGNGDHVTVATISVSDGALKVITSQRWLDLGRIVWFGDGSGMAVAAPAPNWQIWRVSYPGGEVQRITNDLQEYGKSSLTLTADSRTLVALQRESTSNIFIASEGDAQNARAITSRKGLCEGCAGIDWMPDGRIVYASNVGGESRIWVMNADGTAQKPLSEAGKNAVSPKVSLDGRHIFFLSRNTAQIWRMESDGTRPTQLTESGVEDFALTPDGRWIIYDLYAPGIWKLPAEGGTATKLSDTPTWVIRISPDGRLLALNTYVGQTTQHRPTVLKFDDLSTVKTFDLPITASSPPFFSADSSALVYLDTRDGVTNLWRQPLDGSPARQITNSSSDRIGFFAYSRDGKKLAFTRGNSTQNALIISDEQK
jgi:serine/threonine protein kinase/Tol biopolymer transport system component